MAPPEDAKLSTFLLWLHANGAELRGSTIKHCGPDKGFGVFSAATQPPLDGILMVVPLDLAITPMRVLQDPFVGPKCRALFEEGEVDDRFLVMLFLTVERLRPSSAWKPYLDMLPSTFGNPLWFTEEELAELKGTALYRATLLQKKKLQALYDDKVKGLVDDLLCLEQLSESVSEVQFADFLWANSIFWTRALNIPCPHSYVFPENIGGQGDQLEANVVVEQGKEKEASNSIVPETVWVEGLVPGIDFCNHGLKGAATWEIDGTGTVTGIPASMYLILADSDSVKVEKEIFINYGQKGNEELLYLYGFVIDNNPDDYLMVHYPIEAFQNVLFSDRKVKLLEIQRVELRCLLSKSLLNHGLLSANTVADEDDKKNLASPFCNYSWSGRRKVPSYLNNLVFPQEFLTALRTIAMQEHELCEVSSLLEELVGPGGERQPSDTEVQAAVWEVCGDYGALQLLVDLLSAKVIELKEGSGNVDSDAKLLEKFHSMDLQEPQSESRTSLGWMRGNKWSSVVYRRGQKELASLFLREAECALELCSSKQL